MPLFREWCDFDCEENGRKRRWALTEKADSRAAVRAQLVGRVRSHYDELDRIAEDIERLGFTAAAAILGEKLPRTKRARSGDLGEILATELVEEELGYRVPVRRLRYKDGREMALRGDDFVGAKAVEGSPLALLKGEAKSRKSLSAATLAEARKALSRDAGRPTPASLLFVADRLLESADEASARLGRSIRDEVALRAVPPSRIEHALFTVSANRPVEAILADLGAADNEHTQTSANLLIADHQDFIAEVYEEAGALGND